MDNDAQILAAAMRALAAVLLAQKRTPEQIGAVVACLRDNEMWELAALLVPKDSGPLLYEQMLQ